MKVQSQRQLMQILIIRFSHDLSESIEDVLNAMDGPIGDASFFPAEFV